MADYNTIPKAAKSQPSPYRVSVPEDKLVELKQLLKLSKIGPPTYENLHADPLVGKFGLTREWLINAKSEWEAFDWRSVEERLNFFSNYKLKIGEIDLHFIALFSENPDAVPLVLLHGWPGSILEFLSLLSLMKKQYSPKDLPFHLVVPSLPGYGFSSGPPLDHNFTMFDVAETINSLMVELGFGETGYVAHGGDIGSRVSRFLGANYAACKAVHLNFCLMPQPESIPIESLTTYERAGVERGNTFLATESAYAKAAASRPATIGLVLSTNPLALLAWIGEKFLEWTDETPSLNEILASISLYWLTDTYPRSIYPYRESYVANPTHSAPVIYVNKPLGYSSFPKEVFPVPVSWVATAGKLCWSKVHTKGGHFTALEQPESIKEDLENFIAQVWVKE
ncbi:Alpha/Beta hydrolase protein [Xylogone sp. PMI_703]|nr:Alpha/Beta hydrolase protein [Xylogone sp. PMI_703]